MYQDMVIRILTIKFGDFLRSNRLAESTDMIYKRLKRYLLTLFKSNVGTITMPLLRNLIMRRK